MESSNTAGQTFRGASMLASALFLAQFACAFPLRLLPILAVFAFVDAGISPSLVGIFASVSAAGALTGSIAVIWLQPALGSVRALQLAVLMAGLSALCMSGASPGWFLLGSFLAGLADGPTPSLGSAELQRSAPTRLRTSFFSVKMLGGAAGGLTAGVVFPLVAQVDTWRHACWVSAMVALSVVFHIAMTARHWPQPSGTVRLADPATSRYSLGAIRTVWQLPSARRLALLGAVMSVVQGVWYAYYVTYLVEELGQSLVYAGMMMSLSLLGVILSRIVLSLVADAIGNGGRILGWTCLCAAVPWIGILMVGPASVAVMVPLLSVLFGATLGAWIGLQHAELAGSMPPELILPAAGLMTFLMFLGLAASGILFATLLRLTHSYDAGFVALALICLAVGACQINRTAR